MTNQLSKFIPCSAELMKPLTELFSSKKWGPNQSKAFADIKDKLTNAPLLALYDPHSETKVSADASSWELLSCRRLRMTPLGNLLRLLHAL